MIKQYFNSASFKYFLPNWIFGFSLLAFFYFVIDTAKPFERKFLIDNPTLQYPFATKETVSDNLLYFLSVIIPGVLITLVSLYQKRKLQISKYDWLNLLSISLLGLLLSFTITAVVTDVLKIWIARPRPDFLARCAAKKNTDPTKLVGFEVCTKPYGDMILYDGLKSTPSGHSSISFAGLLYLSLWLIGQFKLVPSKSLAYAYFVPSLPIFLATYISLSRTQDYRHHFLDIILGGAIGIIFSYSIYFSLFSPLKSNNSNQANVQVVQENELSLPK